MLLLEILQLLLQNIQHQQKKKNIKIEFFLVFLFFLAIVNILWKVDGLWYAGFVHTPKKSKTNYYGKLE